MGFQITTNVFFVEILTLWRIDIGWYQVTGCVFHAQNSKYNNATSEFLG